MDAVFSSLPLVAASLAMPQFLPQLARLRRTGETAGVSWSWAALTSVNNGGWFGYFALSGFWTALVPAVSATVLAGALAVMLARRRGGVPRRPAVLVVAWAALLILAGGLFGRPGLGILLAAAFALQVTPSVWTAYRAEGTAGVAAGTWLLIFAELACWGVFGVHESDPRLIVLGATGVTASLLILARVARLRGFRTLRPSDASAVTTAGGPGMNWTIEGRDRVAVVTMTTNPVNAQSQAFFGDLHEAFDQLERDHPESPVVLTGAGTRFSAGLDLGEHFPLFAGDPAAVATWFAEYRATNIPLAPAHHLDLGRAQLRVHRRPRLRRPRRRPHG